MAEYKKSIPAEQSPPNIQPSVKWLQQVHEQLNSVQMSFHHVEFIV